jgi:hypothetical protein
MKALAQHRQRDRAPHHGASFVGARLAAVIVVADLDRGQPDPERPFEVQKSPRRQLVARRACRGGVDHLPDLGRKRRLVAVEAVHHRASFSEPIVTMLLPRLVGGAPLALCPASTAFSIPVIGPSLNR